MKKKRKRFPKDCINNQIPGLITVGDLKKNLSLSLYLHISYKILKSSSLALKYLSLIKCCYSFIYLLVHFTKTKVKNTKTIEGVKSTIIIIFYFTDCT